MTLYRRIAVFGLLFGMLALPATPLLADRPGDAAALESIEEGRIIWDVTLGDPEALSARLDVVNATYDDLVRQGVEPRMVFAFRGGAARVIAANVDAHFDLAERNAVLEVQEKLAALLERPGVTMEACSIATRRHELGRSDLIPGVELVGNTFLSLMGYGQRGYVAIPLN